MPHLASPPPTRDTDLDASAIRYFFARSSELCCVLGTDGLVLHANPAFTRATGWTPEFPGATLAHFTQPADRATLSASWIGLLRGRAADELVLRLAEDARWIAWQLSTPDAQGLVYATGRDVTDRETAAHALRESESRYHHIAANLPGVVYQFVYRPDGSCGYTLVSEGARTLFGVSPEDAIADPQTFVRLIHPDEVEQFRARAREIARTLGHFRWEGPVVLASGEERYVQIAAYDYRQPDGTVVSDGLIMDITELHRATVRLEESEQRYRSLFEHNPDGVYSLNLDMRYTSANPACESISGYTPEEIVSGAVYPLVVPDDSELAATGFRDACEGRASQFEVGIRHRSGDEVRLGITNIPIVVGERVVGVFGIAKDLTGRRALEDRLRQAQKMEAVGQLAGGVAHDFNNLLMVIQSYGGFLADEIADGTGARGDLDELLRATERAQELTRQLLAFGRQQVLRPRRLDANRKVTNVAAMLRRIIGEDIALETELEPSVWPIVADPGQVEQVLMNLAVNARDAMPQGGRLRLRTENRLASPEPLGPATSPRAARMVAIVVEDSGIGIPAHVLPRIFEPFYTTKPVGQGTGLGLATVYGIVEQSGGSVSVESTPDVGSRFTIMLPAAEAQAPTTSASDERPISVGKETILLVEDERHVRSAVRRMLERQGYLVREASNGAEALRVADEMAAASERIDLVLTDLVMPELSGQALGERLAECHAHIRMLYMSGYTDDEIFRRGLTDTRLTFIEKPFTADRLSRAVREALEESR